MGGRGDNRNRAGDHRPLLLGGSMTHIDAGQLVFVLILGLILSLIWWKR